MLNQIIQKRFNFRFHHLFFTFISLFILSCNGGGRTPEICIDLNGVRCLETGPNVYKDFIQPILSQNCALCHFGTAKGAAELSLEEGDSYNNLVNVVTFEVPEVEPKYRVVANDTAGSYLYQKLSSEKPKFGAKMPAVGSITNEQLVLIKSWINCGAPGPDLKFNNTQCPGIN